MKPASNSILRRCGRQGVCVRGGTAGGHPRWPLPTSVRQLHAASRRVVGPRVPHGRRGTVHLLFLSPTPFSPLPRCVPWILTLGRSAPFWWRAGSTAAVGWVLAAAAGGRHDGQRIGRGVWSAVHAQAPPVGSVTRLPRHCIPPGAERAGCAHVPPGGPGGRAAPPGRCGDERAAGGDGDQLLD